MQMKIPMCLWLCNCPHHRLLNWFKTSKRYGLLHFLGGFLGTQLAAPRLLAPQRFPPACHPLLQSACLWLQPTAEALKMLPQVASARIHSMSAVGLQEVFRPSLGGRWGGNGVWESGKGWQNYPQFTEKETESRSSLMEL